MLCPKSELDPRIVAWQDGTGGAMWDVEPVESSGRKMEGCVDVLGTKAGAPILIIAADVDATA